MKLIPGVPKTFGTRTPFGNIEVRHKRARCCPLGISFGFVAPIFRPVAIDGEPTLRRLVALLVTPSFFWWIFCPCDFSRAFKFLHLFPGIRQIADTTGKACNVFDE